LRSPCPGRTIRQQYNFIRGRWAAKKRTGRLRRLTSVKIQTKRAVVRRQPASTKND
jgi:hypothetical protein